MDPGCSTCHPFPRLYSLSVDVFTVSKLYDENSQGAILYLAYHPIISNAIAPQTSQWPNQSFAGATRIITTDDPFIHIVQDAFGYLPIQFA
ncbi:hypothetical protein AUC61_15590 [Pseudomonas sp. S25]|uniref:Uncharacterized protein n=1 Tax=Pseudomonas maioricensis TaxID=1766623 RepID=A0ABS9ZK53_9PSED|nr:hypothetical protein [Pseudomonas sp. S25]